MNSTGDNIIKYLLTPLSWLYGGVTGFRNWLFKNRILPVEEFDVPVVSVGNLTVGGTGKTPHVEYIVSLFSNRYKIAVLSRGYKRKTHGFILASSKSTPDVIGDEPLQIYQKFGRRIKVAVCESRRKGIKELLRNFPDLDLIILDDGFQHRYVKPKVSVLLMDYNRPIYNDKLLPLGRLREHPHQINRADMVVVTKCPDELTPIDYRIVAKSLDLMPYQKLYFSRFRYDGLRPVFPDENPYRVDLDDLGEKDVVLLVTGIAYPRNFVHYFRQKSYKVKVMHFPDHHDFKRNDLNKIQAKFDGIKAKRKIIVTTDKDAVRMMHNPYYPRELMPLTYALPIEVEIIDALDSNSFAEELEKSIIPVNQVRENEEEKSID